MTDSALFYPPDTPDLVDVEPRALIHRGGPADGIGRVTAAEDGSVLFVIEYNPVTQSPFHPKANFHEYKVKGLDLTYVGKTRP